MHLCADKIDKDNSQKDLRTEKFLLCYIFEQGGMKNGN